MTTLVIVESKGKISKIQSYLGDKYNVIASLGHVYKLSSVTDDFIPKYEKHPEKINTISNIIAEYKKSKDVLIATDNDREGEMIAWSISHLLKLKKPKRILFNNITKSSIEDAIKNVTEIDMLMVESQRARSFLDMLVGFRIQPLIGRRGLSVGRVQSVVVKLIKEREDSIEVNEDTSFKIEGIFNNRKYLLMNKSEITDETMAKKFVNRIANFKHSVTDVLRTESLSKSPEAYSTSTFQQAAATTYNLNGDVSMNIAQQLYEGGHITYMRTDSTILSDEFIVDATDHVTTIYGDDYVRKEARKVKKTKTVVVQGAHEAIRPTDASVDIIDGLDELQQKVYLMIYNRAIGSIMEDAKYDVLTIKIKTTDKVKVLNDEPYVFSTSTKELAFKGYLILYSTKEKGLNESLLKIKKGDAIELEYVTATESFKSLQHRYKTSSLIEKLDPNNLGIGRPSTYASIIDKIIFRKYVKIGDITGEEYDITTIKQQANTKEQEISNDEIILGKETNVFQTTKLGRQLVNYLEKNFNKLMKYEYTAMMERDLDDIATKKSSLDIILTKYYTDDLKPTIKHLRDNGLTFESFIQKLLFTEGGFNYYRSKNFDNDIVINKCTLEGKKINSIRYPEDISIDNVLHLFKGAESIHMGTYKDNDIVIKNNKNGDKYTIFNNIYIAIDTEDPTLDDIIEKIEKVLNSIKNIMRDDKYEYVIKDGQYGLFAKISTIDDMYPRHYMNVNVKSKDITIDEIKSLMADKNKKKSKK